MIVMIFVIDFTLFIATFRVKGFVGLFLLYIYFFIYVLYFYTILCAVQCKTNASIRFLHIVPLLSRSKAFTGKESL